VVKVLQAHQAYQDSLEQLDNRELVEVMVSQEHQAYLGKMETKVTRVLRDCLVEMAGMVSLVLTVTKERKEKMGKKETKD